MWLRNYYSCLNAIMLSDDNIGGQNLEESFQPPIRAKFENGQINALDFSAPEPYSSSSSSSSKLLSLYGFINIGKGPCGGATGAGYWNDRWGLEFGSGDTPVTYEDYQLESKINSGLTLVSKDGSLKQETSFNQTSHEYSSERTFTVNNSSSSPITISEYGISIYVSASGYGSGAVLVYREVLSNPITLQPSESIVISFKKQGEAYNYTPYPSA